MNNKINVKVSGTKELDKISDRKVPAKGCNDLWAAIIFFAFFITSVILAIIGINKITKSEVWKYDPKTSTGTGYYYDTAYGWLQNSNISKVGYYYDHYKDLWIQGTPTEYIDPKSSLKATSFIAPIVSVMIGILASVIVIGVILSTKQMKYAIVFAGVLSVIGGALAFTGMKYVGAGLRRHYGNIEHIYNDVSRVLFVLACIIILILTILAFIFSSGSGEALTLQVIRTVAADIHSYIIGMTSIAIILQILVFIMLALPLWGFFWVDKNTLLAGVYDSKSFWALFCFQLFCFYWYSEIIRNIVHVKLSAVFVNNILQPTSDNKVIRKSFGSICNASLRPDTNHSVKRSLILVAAFEKNYNDSSLDYNALAIKELQRLIQKDPKHIKKTFSDRLVLYSWAIMLSIGLLGFISTNFVAGLSVKGSLYGLMFFPYGISWTFLSSILAMAEFNLIFQIFKTGANSLQVCSEINHKSYKTFVARFTSQNVKLNNPECLA